MGGHDVGDAAILSFVAWLQAMHAAGRVHGAHTRYVYRLGVSSEDGKAGYAHVWNITLTRTRSRTLTHTLTLPLALTLPRYAHVWNIVAQPDGSFHWLQSFINHYSLPSWLRQSDARSERHVSHTGLEPQTSGPEAGRLLTGVRLALDSCRSRRYCISSSSSAS